LSSTRRLFLKLFCDATNSTQGSFLNPTSQATIHTFFAYLKSGEVQVKQSMRGFSCCTNHNTAAVFSFMKVTIPYFKEFHPNVGKVVHFTDTAVC
jgi:hypothetical protein